MPRSTMTILDVRKMLDEAQSETSFEHESPNPKVQAAHAANLGLEAPETEDTSAPAAPASPNTTVITGGNKPASTTKSGTKSTDSGKGQ